MSGLQSLRGLVRGRRPLAPPEERCHLCGGPVAAGHHPHVVDRHRRTLACACPACTALCGDRRGRYAAVPSRVLVDPASTVDEAAWSALGIPVRLAFLFFNSMMGRWISLYPSPAGAVEAVLDQGASPLAGATALPGLLEPDVEALLVRGAPNGGLFELLLVPIDACYQLVGRVRTCWEGIHGGDRAWHEIDALFAELRARAAPAGAA
jgi:hypothetical protein